MEKTQTKIAFKRKRRFLEPTFCYSKVKEEEITITNQKVEVFGLELHIEVSEEDFIAIVRPLSRYRGCVDIRQIKGPCVITGEIYSTANRSIDHISPAVHYNLVEGSKDYGSVKYSLEIEYSEGIWIS